MLCSSSNRDLGNGVLNGEQIDEWLILGGAPVVQDSSIYIVPR